MKDYKASLEKLQKKTKKCRDMGKEHVKYAKENVLKIVKCKSLNEPECKKILKNIKKNDEKYIQECTTNVKEYKKIVNNLKKDMRKKISEFKKSTKK